MKTGDLILFHQPPPPEGDPAVVGEGHNHLAVVNRLVTLTTEEDDVVDGCWVTLLGEGREHFVPESQIVVEWPAGHVHQPKVLTEESMHVKMHRQWAGWKDKARK